MSNVNWKNIAERLISTTVQTAVGAVAAVAEAVASGQLDYRTALTGVVVAALLSLAKNLQVELSTSATTAVVDATPSDAERAQAVQAARSQTFNHLPLD